MLWRLRFRKPTGVDAGLIDARDFETAQRVGQAFCDRNIGPSYRYIGIEPAILADESILPGYVKPESQSAPEPIGKPTVVEQKAKQKELMAASAKGAAAAGLEQAAAMASDRKPARVGA